MDRKALLRCARFAIVPAAMAGLAWGRWHDKAPSPPGPAWPTVEGTISETRFRACDHGAAIAPEVTYTYLVDGRPHDGTLRFKASHCGTQSAAQDIVDAWPLGSTLPVHVDPRDASRSVVLAP